MEANYCPNCGTALKPGTKFCSNCGEEMKPASNSTSKNILVDEYPENVAESKAISMSDNSLKSKLLGFYILLNLPLSVLGKGSDEMIGFLIYSFVIVIVISIRFKKENTFNWVLKILLILQFMFILSIFITQFDSLFIDMLSSIGTIIFILLSIVIIKMLFNGNQKRKPVSRSNAHSLENRKKGGCLRIVGKAILGIIVLFVIGSVIFYFFDDDIWDKIWTSERPAIRKSQTSQIATKKYPKPNLKTKAVLAETTVNTDTAEVIINATDEISVILPIALLDGEEKLAVKELEPIRLPNGQNCETVLEVTLGDQHEFDDFIEILVSPPSDFNPQNNHIQCLSMSSGKNRWQPVMAFYEPKINKVRMVTDHLSVLTVNSVPNMGVNLVIDPMYTVATETYKYFKTIASHDAVTILKGYNTERISKELNKDYHILSWNTVMDVYGLAGTGLSFLENGAGMSGLSKIGEAAGNIGIGLSVIQIALDAYNGKVKDAQVGVYKTFLNTVVSKGFNTRAMNLALIGVFAIDYSLTTFAKEALAGRKVLYENIWANYQKRQRKNKKNLYWWKKQIVRRMKKAKDPSKFESVVEKIIQEYIQEFWNDDTEMAIIQSEIGPKFTYKGGFNKKLKDELSAEFRLQILQYIKSLLDHLQKKYIYQARKQLSRQFAELANDLNQEQLIRCQVVHDKDEKPDTYEGFKVVFNMMGKEMRKMWQGVMNKDARMDFYCTTAGYIGAGAPIRATLFVPDKTQTKKFEKILATVELKRAGKITHVKFISISCRNKHFHLKIDHEEVDFILLTPKELYKEAEKFIGKKLTAEQKKKILAGRKADIQTLSDYYKNILPTKCYDSAIDLKLLVTWDGIFINHKTGEKSVYKRGYLVKTSKPQEKEPENTGGANPFGSYYPYGHQNK